MRVKNFASTFAGKDIFSLSLSLSFSLSRMTLIGTAQMCHRTYVKLLRDVSLRKYPSTIQYSRCRRINGIN